MAAASPSLLDRTARLLGTALLRRPAALAMGRLSRTRLPTFGADALAARLPEAGLDRPDVTPLLRRFAREPFLDGPLAGEAVVVKDSIDVAGAHTGLGLLDGGDLAAQDAPIVARVRAAGGQLVGKAKMTELGMDGLGALLHRVMPANPRAPGYFPGGSSTGTAVAVASGLARYGLGGDGLGSVRVPAAFCGLVGLAPSRGRLPLSGYPSPAPSMDTPGPLARTAADCALLFQVMAGETPCLLTPHAPPRVGVMRQLGPQLATRSVQVAFRRALASIGATVETVDVPGAEHSMALGAAAALHELARSRHAARSLSPAGRLNVALGLTITPAEAKRIDERRRALREAALRALGTVPVIAMPTTAIPPPALTRALLAGAQDALLLRAIGAYTPLANCTGLPAIAVPCGVDDRGRPLSIMFLGPPGGEMDLLRIALAIERAGLALRRI